MRFSSSVFHNFSGGLIVVLFSFLLCSTDAKSINRLDSLHQTLQTNLPDTSKIKTHYLLAGQYIYRDINHAERHVDSALTLSIKTNYANGIGEGYGWKGFLSRQRGNLSAAIDYNLKSLYVIQAQGFESEYARILNNLATLHLELENYDQAKRYYEECIKRNSASKNLKSLAANYNNLALVYRNLETLDSALHYYNKAITIRTEINDSIGLSATYSNLGTLYEDLDSQTVALSYYEQSLTIRRALKNQKGIAISLYKIGNIYLKQKSYAAAEKFAKEAYAISVKWGFKTQEKDASKVLYLIYKEKNAANQALFYLEKYKNLEDSLNSIDNQKKIIESEYQLAYNKKQLVDSLSKEKMRIKTVLLEKEKIVAENSLSVQRLWTALSILIAAALIVLLIIYRRNTRLKENQLRTEVRLRLSEILVLKDELNQSKQTEVSGIEGINIILKEKLSEREEEILDLLVFGLSNKEIGERLFLSVNTIKTHINNLYIKLDVNNRTQAAVKGSLLKLNENR